MALVIEKLNAFYDKSHVLRNVSMQVGVNETVCLVGRNGVGKSTTLKSIIGLVRPASGEIRYRGVPIAGLLPHAIARAGLGYVPEERRVFAPLTVEENLVAALRDTALRSTAFADVFQFFPILEQRRAQRAGTLSGGEQQILTIARTMMIAPTCLLIDEPTEGLAPQFVERIDKMLRELKRRSVSILLVAQSLNFALSLADRAYVMTKGEIVFEGTPEELRCAKHVQKKFLEV